MALRPWGPPPRLWPHVLDVSGNGHGAGVVHILRRRRGPSSRGWARSRRVGGDSAAAAGATTATRRGDRRGRCRGRGASAWPRADEEAAGLLGVSRPTLVRLSKAGGARPPRSEE